MNRTTLIMVFCWLLGLLFVIGVGWLLDKEVAPGPVKTTLEYLSIGVAISVFGTLPQKRVPRRPVPRARQE